MTRKPGSLPGNPTQAHSSSERVPGEGIAAFRFRTEELGGFSFFRLPPTQTPSERVPPREREKESFREIQHCRSRFKSLQSAVDIQQK